MEGGGRGGTFVQPGYGPILCGRFGIKNARVVKKVGEKETPLGEKETPLGEKVTKVGEKVNFVGEKKIHAQPEGHRDRDGHCHWHSESGLGLSVWRTQSDSERRAMATLPGCC